MSNLNGRIYLLSETVNDCIFFCPGKYQIFLEAYLEPRRTSTMELFAKIVNG